MSTLTAPTRLGGVEPSPREILMIESRVAKYANRRCASKTTVLKSRSPRFSATAPIRCLNATNPDLSKFRAKNGKLLLWHGWSDAAVTPGSSINYFEEVEKLDPGVRDYFRLYLLAGVQHCGSGPGPSSFDWFRALTAWVERGRAPHRVVVSKLDDKGKVTMTRPVYPYPLRAVYKGSGNTNDAENFVLLGDDKRTKATD